VKRYGPVAIADFLAVGLTYTAAIVLRTGSPQQVFAPEIEPFSVLVAMAAGVVQVVSNMLFAVYWRDWSAASLEDMVALVKASVLVVVGLLVFNFATEAHWIPTGAVLAGGSLSVFVEAVLHLRPRWADITRAAIGRQRQADSIIAVGAGRLGQLLAADIAHGGRDYRIACFVDDDPRKLGSYVRGIRVAGRVADLAEIIEQYGAATVVIAIANPPGGFIRRVMDVCEPTGARIRRVSGFSLLRADTTPLQPIQIEELLAREPVDLSDPSTLRRYAGKRILITGAAGSIGSELARQLQRLQPSRLYLLDANESGLHAIELALNSPDTAEILLGDVRDRSWLRQVFQSLRPDIVFHAAAYKHVPILERNPLPGIATNALGTANVLECATQFGVERLVFVSTDKAVEPTNVLGYTKRFGEMLTIASATANKRDFAVVRFGNVLGSVGSAVPVFAKQIDQGGPVTVTHPDVARYFMTIEEAVGLLIEAGVLAKSADVLVLDMGQPVSITELAQRMIRLRGLRTPADIEIRFIGLRPGEKLHESLIASDEQAVGTSHPRITRVEQRSIRHTDTLTQALRAIDERLGQQDSEGALQVLTAVTVASRGRTSGTLVK